MSSTGAEPSTESSDEAPTSGGVLRTFVSRAMARAWDVVRIITVYVRQVWLTKDYGQVLRSICGLMRLPSIADSGLRIVKNTKTNESVAIPEKWIKAQEDIKRRVIAVDTEDWQKYKLVHDGVDEDAQPESLRYVGGVDLSYVKDGQSACAALVVCELPSMKVVYEHFQMKEISVPYVTGFLTFREVLSFLEVIRHLLIEAPHFKPQVILVDGNGLLHPRGAGLACHLGVLADIPCVGVAKNLLVLDNLENTKVKNAVESEMPLNTVHGVTLGAAVMTGSAVSNPVYVSTGHRISLDTAIWLVKLCSQYRIPEPIRQADIRSREYLSRYPKLKKASRPREC